jgi:DNA-binding SARP family transcriptional activator/DNA polymerase III delta prime subunit
VPGAFEQEPVRLQVSLLGPVRVSLDGQPLAEGAAGKVWALLAYLATESARPQRREYLATLLWPDQDDRTTLANLRWALSKLRTELGDQQADPPFLQIDQKNKTLQFNHESSSVVDVHLLTDELTALPPTPDTPLHPSQAAQLAAAVSRYTGDFLESFMLDESELFEEWASTTRERLRQQIGAALAALVAHHARQADPHTTQHYARRWLAFEPLSEQAHRALMLALAQSGQRAAALEQYRVCCQMLADEFGAEPEPATTQLYEDVKQGAFAAPPAHAVHAEARPDTAEVPPTPDALAQTHDAPDLPIVADRDRRMMVQRVQTIWIEGLLERVQQPGTRIDLRLMNTPAPVAMPLSSQYQELQHAPEPVPPDTSIHEVFTQAGEALLILGEPGAGKTTLLLELCRHLLAGATHDPTAPMPVVFNLSSWAAQRHPLNIWLAQELTIRYDIPARIARAWVAADRILPLLDGLDEVRISEQQACVDAINAYRREHLTPLAVCARTADYAKLTRQLSLQCAVIIQPLTDEQIAAYVQAGGAALARLGETLQQDSELRALASTPLMLSILALAYDTPQTGRLLPAMTSQQQRAALFDAYIERVLKRRGAHAPYAPDQTVRWLRWLARQMRDRDQAEFQIEQLQPEWLTTPQQRRQYVLGDRLGWGMLGGLGVLLLIVALFGALGQPAAALILSTSCSLLAGLVVGLFGPPPGLSRLTGASLRSTLIAALSGGALVAVPTGLVAALSALLALPGVQPWAIGLEVGAVCGIGGVFAGLLFGRPRRAPRPIVPIESVAWSWRQFGSYAWRAILLGGLVGAVLHLLGGLLFGGSSPYAFSAIEGSLMGMIVSLPAGITGKVSGQPSTPNQGIRRSARIALVAGSVAALLALLAALAHGALRFEAYGMLAQMINATPAGLVGTSLVLGLGVGLGTALGYGGYAVLSHLALRLVLWRHNTVPLNYTRFLDYCAACILLRKIGGGYQFVHRTLLDYFATLSDDTIARLAQAARTPSDVPPEAPR